MSEPQAKGAYQCPRCYGPSDTLGWCTTCLEVGLDLGFLDRIRRQHAAEAIEAEIKKAIDSYGHSRIDALVFERRVFAILIADTVLASTTTTEPNSPVEFWAPTIEKYRYITDQIAIENEAFVEATKDKEGDNG